MKASLGYFVHEGHQRLHKVRQGIHVRVKDDDVALGLLLRVPDPLLEGGEHGLGHGFAFQVIQKIVDHARLGPAPGAAEEVHADALAQLVDAGPVLGHLPGVLAGLVVAGVIQKVDVLVRIGEVVEAGEGVLQDVQRLLVRGHHYGHGRIGFKLRHCVASDAGGIRSGKAVVDVQEVAEGMKHGEALCQKQQTSHRDFLPELGGDDEKRSARHEVEKNRQHGRRQGQGEDLRALYVRHDAP